MEPEPLWTPEQVAEYLNVPLGRLGALRALGLPTVKLGRTYRYRPESVVAWVASRETGRPDEEEEPEPRSWSTSTWPPVRPPGVPPPRLIP